MSASLTVWLSGFVFLFCCGMMEARAAETEFCPLAKSKNHCDKAKQDKNQTVFSNDSDSASDCCYFLPAVFNKVRKVEKSQQITFPAEKVKIESARFLPVENHFERAEYYEIPFVYRYKIHIKNCVFRI